MTSVRVGSPARRVGAWYVAIRSPAGLVTPETVFPGVAPMETFPWVAVRFTAAPAIFEPLLSKTRARRGTLIPDATTGWIAASTRRFEEPGGWMPMRDREFQIVPEATVQFTQRSWR